MTLVPADWLEGGGQYEANVLVAGHERLSRIYLGEDDENGSIYSLLVSLVKNPFEPEDHREISFVLVELTDEGEQYYLNDGLQTARILEGEHRKRVIELICSVVQSLVEAEDPEVVCMCTVTPDLPERALAKYGYVCKALADIGYEGGKVNPYHGQQMWIMKKT